MVCADFAITTVFISSPLFLLVSQPTTTVAGVLLLVFVVVAVVSFTVTPRHSHSATWRHRNKWITHFVHYGATTRGKLLAASTNNGTKIFKLFLTCAIVPLRHGVYLHCSTSMTYDPVHRRTTVEGASIHIIHPTMKKRLAIFYSVIEFFFLYKSSCSSSIPF